MNKTIERAFAPKHEGVYRGIYNSIAITVFVALVYLLYLKMEPKLQLAWHGLQTLLS